ncbi:hypothetical protein BDQ17DRAFT_1336175 [Cyathus striatus]|nr:hypothetical protein BDQ17DRAFT_1336175 [Cyathus striatus]
MANPNELPPDIQKLSNILSTKYYFVAASTLLLYDYILSFSQEIRLVWRERKTPEPIYQLGILYHNPNLCSRFAIAEFIQTVIIFTIAEIFLSLRIHVLTKSNKLISSVLGIHIITQLILAFYIFSKIGQDNTLRNPVVLTPPEDKLVGQGSNRNMFQICELFPDPTAYPLTVAYLCLALSFDMLVFVLTLWVTISSRKNWFPTLKWVKVVQRDGTIFFLAIFSCFNAPPSLALITAEPDLM